MTPSRVWLAWLAANVLPSVAVSVLLVLVRDVLGTDRAVIAAYVLLFSLVTAMQARVVARWRAPRRLGSERPRRWVVWTIAGLLVAMFFGIGTVATLDGLGHERLGLVTGWAIAGLMLGTAQSVALGVAMRDALWWVIATIAGWTVAAVAYSSVAVVGAPIARAPVMRWLIGGLAVEGNIELAITALTFAAYGLLTGVVMAHLSRPVASRLGVR